MELTRDEFDEVLASLGLSDDWDLVVDERDLHGEEIDMPELTEAVEKYKMEKRKKQNKL
jgi:hypothetical protein